MLRVASIPSAHPYVERLLPAVADARDAGAARLPDPLPEGGDGTPGVWWPPRWLDPEYVRENSADADLVHLHFGFESRTAAELTDWLDALGAAGLPLVLTVHDLQNPHLHDQARHIEALGVLMPRAAHVVTLTEGAADEVERRWGVRPQVLPHPQIADDATILAAPGARDGRPVVGMHLGSLRAGTDPRPWLDRLATACSAHGARLSVIGNDELTRTDADRRAVLDDIAATLRRHEDATLDLVPRLNDDELHTRVGGLDVVVLPYRHGTHSGWVEMCWDLGTPVLAPRIGHLTDQHDDPCFLATLDPATGDGIETGLARLLDAGRATWGDGAARVAARRLVGERVARAHAEVYAAVTA